MKQKPLVSAIVGLLLFSPSAGAQPPTRAEILLGLSRDGPSKGSSEAPVVLIEFSDFQCSFCRKFWQRTLPQLESRYIQAGKVKFVYRHLAILGKHSVAAAEAADCAADQGEFWSYHDKLFDRATNFSAFGYENLNRYAGEMNLRTADFAQCLDSRKYAKKVEGETAVGTYLGVRGTPAFFLNGQLLVGAQPIEVFESYIEKELRKASGGRKIR